MDSSSTTHPEEGKTELEESNRIDLPPKETSDCRNRRKMREKRRGMRRKSGKKNQFQFENQSKKESNDDLDVKMRENQDSLIPSGLSSGLSDREPGMSPAGLNTETALDSLPSEPFAAAYRMLYERRESLHSVVSFLKHEKLDVESRQEKRKLVVELKKELKDIQGDVRELQETLRGLLPREM